MQEINRDFNLSFPVYISNDESRTPIDLILYHAPCSDGFGAAFIAWQVLGDENTKYVPCFHGKPPQLDMMRGKNIIMFDFSYPLEIIREIKTIAKTFLLFDHHISAYKKLKDEAGCYFDMKKSGVVLAWDYFHHKSPIPFMFKCIQARDLYTMDQVLHSKEFTTIMYDVKFDFYTWQEIYQGGTTKWLEMIQKGEVRLREIEEKEIPELADKAELISWRVEKEKATYRVYILNSSNHISAVGNLLANKEGCDFAIIWYYNKEDKCYEIKMRSINTKADISKIAQNFIYNDLPGGGHHNAASFLLSKEDFAITFPSIKQAQ